MKSITIPKYTEMSLVFSVDEDSGYRRVFGASFDYQVTIFPKSSYNLQFKAWWNIWDAWMQRANMLEFMRPEDLAREYEELTNDQVIDSRK